MARPARKRNGILLTCRCEDVAWTYAHALVACTTVAAVNSVSLFASGMPNCD